MAEKTLDYVGEAWPVPLIKTQKEMGKNGNRVYFDNCHILINCIG